MSDVPFGFGSDDTPDDSNDESGTSGDDKLPRQSSGGGAEQPPSSGSGGAEQPDPNDPMAALFGMLGGAGGQGGQGGPDLGQLFQRLGQMFSWSGGPVNWDLANQSARQVVAQAGDRSVSGSERREVDDAFRLAATWLDDTTTFPGVGGAPRTWSRAEWVEGTQAAWQALVEPVAARVSESMSSALPPEVAQAAGPLMGMMKQIGVSMWGGQVGQSIGVLAGEVVGSADIGLPLAEGHPALLPANVSEFGAGLGVEPREVMLYLALREAAHVRLYAHVPWLRGHVLSLVEEYARHTKVDTSAIQEKLQGLDPSNPEALEGALEGGLFDLTDTPEQQAALGRLELALALVEGWVDDVVTQATQDRLPSAGALAETVRRRRATGGPAEQTFSTLVGLKLRPRRMREAAVFWAAVRDDRGVDGRDALWAHPDLMPTADDLGDPAAFLAGGSALDLSGLDDTVAPAESADKPSDDDEKRGNADGPPESDPPNGNDT